MPVLYIIKRILKGENYSVLNVFKQTESRKSVDFQKYRAYQWQCCDHIMFRNLFKMSEDMLYHSLSSLLAFILGGNADTPL